jgi:hypothetical protein
MRDLLEYHTIQTVFGEDALPVPDNPFREKARHVRRREGGHANGMDSQAQVDDRIFFEIAVNENRSCLDPIVNGDQ